MTHLVRDAGRHPDRLLRRHHPGARRRGDLHDAAVGIEKLAAPVVVPGPQPGAVVVEGERRGGTRRVVPVAGMSGRGGAALAGRLWSRLSVSYHRLARPAGGPDWQRAGWQ